MDGWSVIFGAALGVLLGIPCGYWFYKKHFKTALGVGLGSGGGFKVIDAIADLGQRTGLATNVLVAVYGLGLTLTVLTAMVILRKRQQTQVGPPPAEAEMTPEQWNRLSPLQRNIVRMILHEGKSFADVAKALGVSQDDVKEEFANALSTAS